MKQMEPMSVIVSRYLSRGPGVMAGGQLIPACARRAGDLIYEWQRPRGWGDAAAIIPVAVGDCPSRAALAPNIQAVPPAARGLPTASCSSADADAVSAASLLSISHQMTSPLPCVREHAAAAPESCPGAGGCANVRDRQNYANQAEIVTEVGPGSAAGGGGEAMDPAQHTSGNGSLVVHVNTPAVGGVSAEEQEEQCGGAADSILPAHALQPEDDGTRRAVSPAPSALPWPTGAALAAQLIARHRGKMPMPAGSGGQPRPTCGAATARAPSDLIESRSRGQDPECRGDFAVEEPARARGLATGDPCAGMQHAAVAMSAAAVTSLALAETGCGGKSDGSAVPAASEDPACALPHNSDGGDAPASSADCEGARVRQHFPSPAAEAAEACPCPGNPFAAARMQYSDDTEDRPPTTSVRRRTPTPLLSSLRPDYRGRTHPLLRW